MAGLLLVSRPVRPGAWRWALLFGVLLGLWISWSQGLVEQTDNAMAILATGGFIALSLSERRGAFTRALGAVLLALVAITIWFQVWHVGWRDVQLAVTRQWWAVWRALAENPRFGPGALDAQDFLGQMAAAGDTLARLYPARLVLAAMLGVTVSSAWAERMTGRAVGAPVQPLQRFRFSDHLVWVLIAAGLVLLLPGFELVQRAAQSSQAMALLVVTLEFWSPVAENALVVCLALFGLRGVAVLARFTRPGAGLLLAGVLALVLLPFVVPGLILLGLADIWGDFRSRAAPPPTGGG